MKFYSTCEGRLKAFKIFAESPDILGRMVTPYGWKYPKEGFSWVLDNGAYTSFVQNKEFNSELFKRTLAKIPDDSYPEWVVCPDIVGGGLRSMNFSLSWIDDLPEKYNYLLAIQEDMPRESIIQALKTNKFIGIFIGGKSKNWKLKTSKELKPLVHDMNLIIHVGRISSITEVSYCMNIGIDSIDSSTIAQTPGGWIKAKKRYEKLIAILHQNHYQSILLDNGIPSGSRGYENG